MEVFRIVRVIGGNKFWNCFKRNSLFVRDFSFVVKMEREVLFWLVLLCLSSILLCGAYRKAHIHFSVMENDGGWIK